LHEVKHDGHRLIAIAAGGELKPISRNGLDRTALFRLPFEKLHAAGLPAVVFDGEIAIPDERGATHIDLLSEALRQRGPRGSLISPSKSHLRLAQNVGSVLQQPIACCGSGQSQARL